MYFGMKFVVSLYYTERTDDYFPSPETVKKKSRKIRARFDFKVTFSATDSEANSPGSANSLRTLDEMRTFQKFRYLACRK